MFYIISLETHIYKAFYLAFMKLKETQRQILGLKIIELKVVGYKRRPVYSEESC